MVSQFDEITVQGVIYISYKFKGKVSPDTGAYKFILYLCYVYLIRVTMELQRFGVSLEKELLDALDSYAAENRFPNRSQALRHLIRKSMVEKKWQGDEQVAGAIVLVYDHHKHGLQHSMTHLQHDFNDLILSVQHVHLDHDHCLETIAVKGKSSQLIDLATRIIGLKGIHHGELVMTGT